MSRVVVGRPDQQTKHNMIRSEGTIGTTHLLVITIICSDGAGETSTAPVRVITHWNDQKK